jgi:hypothetical protein
MRRFFRRRMKITHTVEFCEACAQVRTGQCRAGALFDKARTQALQLSYVR